MNMILPAIQNGPNTMAKHWFASYFETEGENRFYRYLHRTGWKLEAGAPAYFESKDEPETLVKGFCKDSDRVPMRNSERIDLAEQIRMIEDDISDSDGINDFHKIIIDHLIRIGCFIIGFIISFNYDKILHYFHLFGY